MKKAEHSIENITDSFFAGQPELASGIAKIDFIDEKDEARLVLGDGFNVVSNENLNRFYFPLNNKLYTADAVDQVRQAAIKYAPSGVEKTGFVSSNQLHPPVSRLVTYRYLGNFDPIRLSRNYLEVKSPDRLKTYGVLSLKEFTLVQGYFVEQIECYDDRYVLLYVRSTGAKDAGHFLQAIDAHTAQVLYTTAIDERQPLRECLRYEDGFALSGPPDVYTVSLAGHLTKHTPVMYNAK